MSTASKLLCTKSDPLGLACCGEAQGTRRGHMLLVHSPSCIQSDSYLPSYRAGQ